MADGDVKRPFGEWRKTEWGRALLEKHRAEFDDAMESQAAYVKSRLGLDLPDDWFNSWLELFVALADRHGQEILDAMKKHDWPNA